MSTVVVWRLRFWGWILRFSMLKLMVRSLWICRPILCFWRFFFFVRGKFDQDLAGENIKGQLISKCPFGVIVWTKIPTKLTWRAYGVSTSFWHLYRDIHIECSKQFKWNLYFYLSRQSGLFWAVLKLLQNSNMKFK